MSRFQFLIRIQFLRSCFLKKRAYFLSVLLFFVYSDTEAWADNHYEIVTYAGVSEKALSINSLRSIFSMRLKTWPDGTKVRVFVLSDDDPLHQSFSKEKLNVFPYQLRAMWDRLVFSGTGQAPTQVKTNEEMLEKIANTPGAIGYLLRANMSDNVNVLKIK